MLHTPATSSAMLTMNLSVLSALVMSSQAVALPEVEHRDLFARFQQRYNKTYADEDADIRFATFKENMATALALNDMHDANCTDLFGGCAYGVTPFSDMSEAEFRSKMTGYKPSNNTNEGLRTMAPTEYAKGRAYSSFDWRAKGKVSPIKNQNPCGFCWAFSAASTIESAYAIQHKTHPPVLSPQQIVDCDGKHSCTGPTASGDVVQALQYVDKAGGISLHSHYHKLGACQKREKFVKVTGVIHGPQHEHELAAAVAAHGPFSIVVAAGSWQHWTGGTRVMTQCPGPINHAVSIVGFDKSAKVPYWIVRNQWGKEWGHNGYIYLEMNHNMCQLATKSATVHTVKAPTASEIEEVVV